MIGEHRSLYVLKRTEKRLGFALVFEGERPVYLEFVRQGNFHAIRGFCAETGDELYRWRGGGFSRPHAATEWHDKTNDWTTAFELCAGRL